MKIINALLLGERKWDRSQYMFINDTNYCVFSFLVYTVSTLFLASAINFVTLVESMKGS